MRDRLTDEELRRAAASRPGYATYPQYRTGQVERLASFWRGGPPTLVVPGPTVVPVADLASVRPARPVPPPAAHPVQYLPTYIAARPWWRPRWHWLVIARDRFGLGYTWTAAGARRRTRRYARRAAR